MCCFKGKVHALTALLFRYNAICLAGGLYFTLPFAPTRLKTADDPTRGREVRPPGCMLDISSLSSDRLRALLAIPPLRRWASNWVRLVIGLCGFPLLDFLSPRRRRHGLQWPTPSSPHSYGFHTPSVQSGPSMDFDATLGFPGEGPSCYLLSFFLAGPALLLAGHVRVVAAAPSHGCFGPTTPGDWKRVQIRQSSHCQKDVR